MQKKTVAVDMDGVLADYSKGWQGIEHIGDPIPGAREFLAALREFAEVVIWTTRCNPGPNGRAGEDASALRRRVEDWMKRHDMPYDDVFIGTAKPLVAAIIDDRAVSCRPQDDARAFALALMCAKSLCDGEPLGATGQFPAGKLRDDDEGGLRMAVGVVQDQVIVDFGKPVAWFALPASVAKTLAVSILQKAETICLHSTAEGN